MPQSLAKVYVHLVFSSEGRAACISDAVRPALLGYLSGILHNLECRVTRALPFAVMLHAVGVAAASQHNINTSLSLPQRSQNIIAKGNALVRDDS